MPCVSQIFEAQTIKLKQYLVSLNTSKYNYCSDDEWVVLTLSGWFPRTPAALLHLSDNPLSISKPTLATAAITWQMCSS